MATISKSFKTMKEAKEFQKTLTITSRTYKGHRKIMVQYELEENNNVDDKQRMSTDELNEQIKFLYDRKIQAVKLVQIEFACGLKEALDYCKKVWG